MSGTESEPTGASTDAVAERATPSSRALSALAAFWVALSIATVLALPHRGLDGFGSAAMLAIVCGLMLLAEIAPLDVEMRQESYLVSFGMVATVLAAFLLAPAVAVAARLAVSLWAYGLRARQPTTKLLVNLASHTLEMTIAALVVGTLAPAQFGPAAWPAAYLAAACAHLAATTAIDTAITVAQGRWDPGMLSGNGVSFVVDLSGTTVAILVITLVEVHAAAAWLQLAVGAGLFLAVRSYSRVAARYRGTKHLDHFTRRLSAAVIDGNAVRAIVVEAADILHADRAWLLVRDGEAHRLTLDEAGEVAWSPATADDAEILDRSSERAVLELDGESETIHCRVATDEQGRSVVLVVADRSGSVRGFDDGDVRLVQTLATHAGLAIQNLELLDRLRDQVAQAEHRATHDALTDLPNRVHFQRSLDRVLADGEQPAVLLLDLDRFRDVNDTLGHHNGDLLLIEIGRRLVDIVGDAGLVARLGGDEFAALVVGAIDARALALRVAAAVERPVRVSDVDVEVGASIGLAVTAPDVDITSGALIRQADVAMYNAKSDRSLVEQYSPDRDTYSPERLSLVGQLRQAIDRGELVLHYQPQIDMCTGEVYGAEALARWPRSDGRWIPPDEFIHIAEHTGLIRPLTALVIDLAVAQAARWHAQHRGVRVSLNLSAHNLVDPEIPTVIADALAAAGLPATQLMVELTETTVMSNPTRALQVIEELRAIGVGLAIDDFGTGHSSLAYLSRLPVTELKIDRSFVMDMADEPTATSIVRTIVDLGRNLELDVIAEGVENDDIASSLIDLGCHHAQGFHYSRPLEPRAFETWHAHHDAELAAAHRGAIASEQSIAAS